MTKTKKVRKSKELVILYGCVVVLAIVSVVLGALLVNTSESDSNTEPSVSLGSMAYDFSNDKAVRRDDASARQLQSFLEQEAMNAGCPVGAPAYEHVVAYTEDEDQVFLHYGCGAADSPMFAVKVDGEWKGLSPTNHFDSFNTPNCDYLRDNSISQQIAPVCVLGDETGNPTYIVR